MVPEGQGVKSDMAANRAGNSPARIQPCSTQAGQPGSIKSRSAGTFVVTKQIHSQIRSPTHRPHPTRVARIKRSPKSRYGSQTAKLSIRHSYNWFLLSLIHYTSRKIQKPHG